MYTRGVYNPSYLVGLGTIRTVKLGILGFPLSHSLSPAMHEAALKAAGLEGSYQVLPTPPEFLRARIQEVRREFAGVNVTIPLKERVIPHLDELSDEARAVGAVNTIVNRSGLLVGLNTDAPGFLKGLEEAGIPYKRRRVLVLGAGGAARGVAYALKKSGAKVLIHNRTPERAEALAAELGVGFLTTAALAHALKTCDLLVNTTSVGMKDPDVSPLQGLELPRSGTVVDIVYNPQETRLLRDAQAAGLRTLGGLPMLVWQGALAFELWTGVKPDVDVMYASARAALEPR
jgi:shikimate dehydrogenase